MFVRFRCRIADRALGRLSSMPHHLLVPGRGVPRPEHWLNRWATDHPEYVWAPYPPGPPYLVEERVADLHAAISASPGPVILIAHSAGCITVAVGASRYAWPVSAALLVAPPYLDPHWTDPDGGATDWSVLHQRLPFRAVVVASRTDPHSTFADSEALAASWGAELVDAGDAGHIDTKSGYGPWPDGERLLASLAAPPPRH
jgi:predicted alpha/beta hydrolase family esterase